MIATVSKRLTDKTNVKSKRDTLKVAASIGRIFERYKIEKFFSWSVGNKGEVTWKLKKDIVAKEEILDGCYIIRTDVDSNTLDKDTVVESYRNLQRVEFAFKNIKTVALELRPMYHKTDDRLKAHIFLTMLAYYIQWHAMEKLSPLFKKDGSHDKQRWTFKHVIERLKSIRNNVCLVKGVIIKSEINQPDKEQQEILDLLGVKLPEPVI